VQLKPPPTWPIKHFFRFSHSCSFLSQKEAFLNSQQVYQSVTQVVQENCSGRQPNDLSKSFSGA
jgi:hypothetical protein